MFQGKRKRKKTNTMNKASEGGIKKKLGMHGKGKQCSLAGAQLVGENRALARKVQVGLDSLCQHRNHWYMWLLRI